MSGQEQAVPRLVATSSQTVGPFFHFGLTAEGATNAADLPAGLPRAELVLRVRDGEGHAVADAAVEIWYAASAPDTARDAADIACLFARLPTREDGTCTFAIAWPVGSPAGAHDAAAHVNVCLFARGLLRHLHTRIYFSGDPANAHDAVLQYVPEARRGTLLATRDPAHDGRWLFDLRLQGPDETVFFDC
jgi:protocatechuate 3,4-dioxygenase alpha subunit